MKQFWDDLKVEQVERLLGTFYNGSKLALTLKEADWFVPYETALPVMVKRKCGGWYPRGF